MKHLQHLLILICLSLVHSSDAQIIPKVFYRYLPTSYKERDGSFGFGYIENKHYVQVPNSSNYDYISSFKKGYAEVKRGKQYGLLDINGNEIVPCEYESICFDGNEFFSVEKNGLWGVCSIKGEEIIPCSYVQCEVISNSFFAVKFKSKEERYSIINLHGNILFEQKYDLISPFKEGRALVRQFLYPNDKYRRNIDNCKNGFINENFSEVIPLKYYYGQSFSEGLAAIKNARGYHGFIDYNGNVVIEPKYDWVYSFKHGVALVKKGDFWGLINKQGTEVLPIRYPESFFIETENMLLVKIYNAWQIPYVTDTGAFITFQNEAKRDSLQALNGDTLLQLQFGAINYLAKDYQEAERWVKMAANFGNENAKKLLASWGHLTYNQEHYNPTPNNIVYSTFDWLSYQSSTTEKQITLKVGIKSPKQIRKVDVYLNGQLYGETRDMHIAHNDGYDYLINKTLMLRDGENTIEVKVTNSDGISSDKKTITYAPQPIPIKTAERRFALVIGNGAYTYRTLPPLNNTSNDARDMASKLTSLGFVVTSVSNVNRDQLWDAIDKFMKKVEHSDVALIYYSGHGLSPKGGANYLIPIDAKIDYLDEIDRYCVNSKTALLSKMEKADVKAKIILLDCCNNCNVPERGAKSTSHSGGLSEMKPEGVYILHAAQPGKTADDNGGNGRNSPFVISFLECCEKYSNLSWNDFAPKIITTVKSKTQSRQIPYPEGYIEGQLFLSK